MLNFDVPDMYVKDYNSIFPGKQKALLDALENAEREHCKDTPVVVNKSKRCLKKSRISTKPYRHQESIFKVPEVPFKVGNVKHIMVKSTVRRGNWIKYDLSNVSADDMTESTNARTAFSFLKELEDRKRHSKEIDEVDPQNFKPIFKKRNDDSVCSDSRTNVQSTIKRSTIDIRSPPETGTSKNSKTNNIIKLNHLTFDDTE